jgi:hypothetical protein
LFLFLIIAKIRIFPIIIIFAKNILKNATSIIIENKFDFNMNNGNNKIVKK